MLELQKGFNVLDNETGEFGGFIPEGSLVNVKLITGEIKEGYVFTKPMKKELRLTKDNVTEVVKVGSIVDMWVGDEEEDLG